MTAIALTAWALFAALNVAVSVTSHLRRVAAIEALEAPRGHHDDPRWVAIDSLMAPFGLPMLGWLLEPAYRGDVRAIRAELLADYRREVDRLEGIAFAPYEPVEAAYADPIEPNMISQEPIERAWRRSQVVPL